MKHLKFALPALAALSLGLTVLPAVAAPSVTTTNDITQDTAISLGVSTEGTNAYIHNNVAKNATGNVGFNVAAGIGNKQGNSAVISLDGTTLKSTTAQSIELTAGLTFGGDAKQDNTTANIGDSAFQKASGNIGASVAAGQFNQQANSLQISTAKLESATAKTSQTSAAIGGLTASGITASLTDNAFKNASGNVGVNVAAGVANAQSNMLLLQTAR